MAAIFSTTVIIATTLVFINFLLFYFVGTEDVKKYSRFNLILAFIFLCMKIPENLTWVTDKDSFYIYWKVLYTIPIILLFGRTLIYFFIDITLTKNIKGPKIFYDILRGFAYFLIIMFILKENGVSLNSIFTTSAILTAVVGLALQNTLSDIVAGLIISTEKTLKIGDWIKYNDTIGEVVQYTWRYAKIITIENEHLIIPNKDLTAKTISVYSSENFKHYMKVPFGVTYENLPNPVIDVAKKSIKNVKDIKDIDIFFVEYGDFAILFEVRFYLLNPAKIFTIKSEILTNIFYAFQRTGIEIPIPRYDLFFKDYGLPTVEEIEQENVNFIKTIDFLSPLSDEEVKTISKTITLSQYAKGEYILEQNQENSTFFYIKSGEADVIVNGTTVATLGEKQFFGEISLMTGGSTTATIVAKNDMWVYELKSDVFHEIFQNNRKLIDAIGEEITIRKLKNEKLKKSKKDKTYNKKMKSEKAKMIDHIKKFFSLN